jgi:uncharacterized membrane protein
LTGSVLLALAVFGACAVEMVEALTIVMAAGVTRGWRSALEGAAVALVLLAVIVAVTGPALVHYVPLFLLRLVVGGLLLTLGLQWLRKAILRAGGVKAMHDEDAIYKREVARLSALPAAGSGRDATGFVIGFKGVFLEGMEVVMIVLTLGASSGRLRLAVISASAAVVVIGAVGLLVARQLSEVPENTLKIGVGLMLVSFGTFWSGEGAGVHWPGSDLAILGLLAAYGLLTFASVRALQRSPLGPDQGAEAA